MFNVENIPIVLPQFLLGISLISQHKYGGSTYCKWYLQVLKLQKLCDIFVQNGHFRGKLNI